MFDHDFHFGFNEFSSVSDDCPVHLTIISVNTDWDRNEVHDYNDPIHTYSFVYTISGSAIIEYEDGTKKVMNPRDSAFIFFPSNVKIYTNPESEELWRYFYINYICGEPTSKRMSVEIVENTNMFFTLPPNSLSLKSALSLITSRRKGLICQKYLAASAAYDFISKLYNDTVVNNVHYSTITQDCIKIIKERYAKLSGIQELAEMLMISPEHLTRTFKKETGMSPIKYLTNIRLENALLLLLNTNFTISEIASKVGFESGSYFTRVFKAQMSISPSAYRRETKF